MNMSGLGVEQVQIINESGMPLDEIERAMWDQDRNVAQLMSWAQNMQPRSGGIIQRDRYLTSTSLFRQFETARYAMETDNVVSGVADTTEQLAFNEIRIECDDPDEEDVWNQIADDIDLMQRFQEIWRELFGYTNCNVATRFGRKNYTPGGKTEAGNQRRKVFKNLQVPTGITVMDVARVVPVGDFLFGDERLAYIADMAQIGQFTMSLNDPESSDDIAVAQLIESRYPSDPTERRQINEETGAAVTPENMFLLRKDRAFRISGTRPSYERFASCRMVSVFELLDLKQQLRQMDRALLIGGTQFILLVKKGTEKDPAVPSELQSLGSQFRSMARVPVIVDDHRLSIEIITPKTDHVLTADRHRLLDSTIAIRLFQIFQQAGNSRESGDDSTKLIRVVARSMEARRKLIRNAITKHILMPTFEMNDQLKEIPKIKFYPERISLDFDPNIITTYLDLRQMNQISMESLLAQFDLHADEEYDKMKFEFDTYKDIIQPVTQPGDTGLDSGGNKVPPGAPEVTPPGKPAEKTGGRRGGGNNNGGGANRQSLRSGPPRGPAKPDAPAKKK